MSLTNQTVALAEGRQLEELAGLLEREGAVVVRCPLLSILDVADPKPVVAWLRDLVAGRFDLVVLLTGEGLRRLLGFAERAGLRDAAVAALAQTRTITRGPKPGQALREVGLAPSLIAAAPTTEGVIETLRRELLQGKAVAVQRYSEANPSLDDFLRGAGATVHAVRPYVYAPLADADRVADLIARLDDGSVQVVVFTSSPQVDRLFEVANDRGAADVLSRGLARSTVAAVGPVVAETLRRRGARVDVCPEQGFVMKNLVQHLKRHLDA